MDVPRRHRVIDQEEFQNPEEKRKGITKLIQLIKYEDEPAKFRISVWTQRTNPDGTKSNVYSPWPATFLPEEAIKLCEAIERILERYAAYLEMAQTESTVDRHVKTRGIFDGFNERN